MTYRTVVCDPPWTPTLHATNWRRASLDKAGPQKHYGTLTVDEIIDNVPPTAEQAHLYLWVLSQHIDWGYDVARAWGFEVVQTLTWCKPGLGCGRFQCNTEHILVCRRGRRAGNPFGMSHGTWFQWPRSRHSKKPDEFYRLVEEMSPSAYLEMYARSRRPGWDAWGNEVESDITL